MTGCVPLFRCGMEVIHAAELRTFIQRRSAQSSGFEAWFANKDGCVGVSSGALHVNARMRWFVCIAAAPDVERPQDKMHCHAVKLWPRSQSIKGATGS